MADNFQILLSGTLDKTSTKANLNSQVDKLKGQIKHIELNAKLSKSSLDSIRQQINSLNNQDVNLKTNLVNKTNLEQQGIKAGKEYSYAFGRAANLELTIDDDKIITQTKTAINRMDALISKASKSKIQLDTEKFDTLVPNVTNLKDVQKLREYLALARSEYQRLNALMSADIPDSAIENMTNGIKEMQANINKLEVSFAKLRDPSNVGGLKTQIDQISEAYRELENTDNTEEKIKAYSKLKNEISYVKNEISAISQIEKMQPEQVDVGIFENRIKVWMQENTRAAEYFSVELDEILLKLKSADSVKFGQLKKEFNSLTKESDALNLSGKTLGQQLMSNASKFTQWFSISQIIMGATRSMKQMVAEVKTLDASMVNLRKVTNATDNVYDKFLTNSTQKAKALGSSISDFIEISADFARLGYSLDESSQLAEVATLYRNVGDGISITDASNSMISTMKAFNIEADDSIKIIDKLNMVGNNFAISSAGIGEALQRSASALASANNTLDESIALITAGNVTVQNPEKVGTALQTMSMRLRSTSTELEQMGEDTDGAAESVSQLRDLLLGLTKQKVDIQLDEDTYKSTYQTMLEMSKVWDDLTDIERASALEAMFGKRQANVGAGILLNMAEAEDVLAASLDSAGSALAEQEEIQKGIEHSMGVLKNSLQELAGTTLDSSTIKFFVDLLSGVVSVTSAMGGLIPIVTTVGVAMGVYKTAMKTLIIEKEKQTLSTLAATAAEIGYGNAIKATGKAMLANPATWAIMAASAIAGLVKMYENLSKASEEAIQSAKELKEEYEESSKSIKSNIDTIKSLEGEFETLSRGVNDHGKNISLSTEEYERYKDIVSQIVDISPLVKDGYDKEGNAIADKNDLIERSIELLKEERRQKLIEQTTDESNWTIAQGAIETYKKNLKQAENDALQIATEFRDAISTSLGGEDMSDEVYESLLNTLGIEEAAVRLSDAIAGGHLSNKQSMVQLFTSDNAMLDEYEIQKKIAEALVRDFDNLESLLSEAGLNIDTTNIKFELEEYNNTLKIAEQSTKDFNEQLWLNAEKNANFENLDEGQVSILRQFVDEFKFIEDEIPTEYDIKKITSDIYGLVDTIYDIPAAKKPMLDLTELIASSDDIPVEEYIQKYKELVEQILLAFEGEEIKIGDQVIDISLFFNPQIEDVETLQAEIQVELDKLDLDKLELRKMLDFTAELNMKDLQLFYEILTKPHSVYDSFEDFLNAFNEAKFKAEEEDIEIGVKFKDESDSLSSIEKLKSSIADIATEMENAGTIGIDSINKLISAYPQLSDVLHGYINGLYTEQEVMSALSDEYDRDVENYQKAIIAKYDTDTDFYNKVYSNNTEAIKSFSNNYNLDYKNWHNLAQAKLDIDNKLIRELSKGWAGYFNVVKNAAGSYQVELDGRPSINSAYDAKKFYQAQGKAQSAANQANKALKELDKLMGLNLSLPSAKNITSKAIKDARDKASKANKSKSKDDNTDYLLESFEAMLAELQYKREKDIISEKQYLNSLDSLNNQYFKGKSKYLDQYRKYEVEVYQGLKRLEEQRLSDIQSKYDDRLSVIQNTQEEIQHQIDLLESQGNIVGVGFYNQLSSNAQQQIKLLNQEKSEIQSLFNSQLSSGFIKSGTNEYYDFIQALNDVDSKIRDLTLQTVKWGKAIEDIVVNAFDDLIDNIEHLNSELSVLYDMLGNKKLTDEVGFTKEGIASIGLLAQQIEVSQFKIKEYSDEIKRLSKNYKENEERIEELKEAQWDEMRTTQSLRDAIVDLNRERVKSIEEGLKKEYDAYQKIIQAKKDALDSEKNLHDYQNRIAEKEKDVVSLRRQLTTLELDDSDEARTRSALLREELAKAEKALQEEQYNHSIDKQKEALDKELEDYQAQIDEKMMTLEEYLENENQVIADSLELAKNNASSVAIVIADLAIEHGIEVSDAVVNPWLRGANAIASYGDALSSLTSKFTAELNKMATEMDKLLQQANKASKVTISTPKPSPAPAKPTTSSSSRPKPSSSSSSSNKKSLPLASVRYTGNKSRLNKETSIVDKTLSTLNTLNCGKLLRAFNY